MITKKYINVTPAGAFYLCVRMRFRALGMGRVGRAPDAAEFRAVTLLPKRAAAEP